MTTKSRLATLLEAYGIGTTVSLREAARRAGISRQTLTAIVHAEPGTSSANVRQQRDASLRKVADAFDIPFDLIKREAMADWGQIRSVNADTVQEVLAQIEDWHPTDLIALSSNVARILGELAEGRRRQPPN